MTIETAWITNEILVNYPPLRMRRTSPPRDPFDDFPSPTDLASRFFAEFGDVKNHGWRIRMRSRFGYHEPDAWYEAVVDRLVKEDCTWLEVGGGKIVFPGNRSLAERIVERCRHLVSVDPSDNLDENRFCHEKVKTTIAEYRSERRFDLATLRMVAEHIEDPASALASLARVVKTGGKVVIYTPNYWSPAAFFARLIPFRFHQFFTHFLWQTEQEDVFPTFYRMNTRRRLRDLFRRNGFEEVGFMYLGNCTTFQRFRCTCFLELLFWRVLRGLNLKYPENVLLGVYEKT